MDFWIFVAAAGAGCIAKRLQNASIDRCRTSKPSSAVSSSRVSGSYPSHGLARRKILDKDKSKEEVDKEEQNPIEPDATSRDDSQSNVWNFEEVTALPHSNLLGNSSKDEADVEIETGYNICNSLDVRYLNNRNSIRSRYLQGRYRKPLTSLESCCLVAQLYDHQGFLASSPTLPPPIRPLVVTDGSHIISHFGDVNEERKLNNKVYAIKSKSVLGVPPLPNCRKIPDSKRLNSKQFHQHEGTLEGESTKVLCVGIFLGIMVSSIAGKKEVENLKGKLKQTDHLVEDLQEELEMRDSMTVKELACENYESQDTSLPEKCMVKFDDKDPCTVVDEGRSPDSMTRIEAELEAELEMLGLNMKIANTGKRLSNVEIDPDVEVNFARGELREDGFSDQLFDENEGNGESGTISTTPCANYAVSPRQLSLRLHEVLESRLEERIEELELALQQSQSKLERGEESRRIGEPLVMNLSGEALNAYDEACEELMKFESEEEDDSPLDDEYLENDDYEEEKQKLLIQQIVERSKKGSPALFNVLLSIDD